MFLGQLLNCKSLVFVCTYKIQNTKIIKNKKSKNSGLQHSNKVEVFEIPKAKTTFKFNRKTRNNKNNHKESRTPKNESKKTPPPIYVQDTPQSIPLRIEKNTSGDNLHPSSGGDLQSRLSCYPHRKPESDCGAWACAASVAVGGGSRASNAGYTSSAAAA